MADEDLDANLDPHETPPTAGSAQNARSHPDEWVTEDEPMTEAQASLLHTLCREAGEPFDPDLSKAQASEQIEALQKRSLGARPPRVIVDDQTDG
jgi:hypothetical protein